MLIMKLFLTILVVHMSLWSVELAPKLSEKFSSSQKCKSCHQRIVDEWSRSNHARSHYDSNEYLKKTMDYYSKKTRKSLSSVKIECARCHNPRISSPQTDIYYDIDVLMKVDANSAATKAANDPILKEGVNCLVCHNIDQIKGHSSSQRGVERIAWNEVGVMSGPFNDAVSPYHETQYRDFFDDPNKICFICHSSDHSIHNLIFANTKKEFGDSKQKCADCHMSLRYESAASNFPIHNNMPKKRLVRNHGFRGAHSDEMLFNSLDLTLKSSQSKLFVTISNSIPHSVPTGFGARELILEVEYHTDRLMRTDRVSLTQHYKDKRGKPTIPHLAKSATKENSIPADSNRTFKFDLLDGAEDIKATLYFRLVNDEVREILKLEDPKWSKKSVIDSAELKL